MKISAVLGAAAWLILGLGSASAQEPISATTGASPLSAPYSLGPGDEIRVSVFNEPDLGVQQRVGADGSISVPLVGDINANGMSPQDLARALQDRFRGGFLRNPQVSVAIVTYRPFFIIGEVNNAGAFPYSPNLTIGRAIAIAGGFSRRASRGEVYVKRQGELTERAYPTSASLSLSPGDTIRVGQSVLSILTDLPLALIPH